MQSVVVPPDHTHTLGKTPLDEGSARHTDLYLTTQNIHQSKYPSSPAAYEPAVPANERPQTDALDRAATGTGDIAYWLDIFGWLIVS